MLGAFGGGRGGARGGRGGGAPAAPELVGTQGHAIDHIGFEVADLDATVAHLESMGVEVVNRRTIGNLSIGFLTDPNGTYIELTQGLGQ